MTVHCISAAHLLSDHLRKSPTKNSKAELMKYTTETHSMIKKPIVFHSDDTEDCKYLKQQISVSSVYSRDPINIA